MKIGSVLGIGLTAGLLGIVYSWAKPESMQENITKVEFYNPWVNPENKKQEENSIKIKIDENKIFAEYTTYFEGRRAKVYDPNPNDGKPEPTIGTGHYMDRPGSRQTFKEILPEVDYDAVYNGRESLSMEQIDRLFTQDIKKYVAIARRIIPGFDKLPTDVKAVLVDKAFRGDLMDSPRAVKLFNAGKIEEAADEFLNRRDYKDAEKNKMGGLKIRLKDYHDNTLRAYAKSIESKKN